MGLLSIANAAARIGFAVAGDVKVAVTVKTGPTNTHDTTTDLTSTAWQYTTVPDVLAISYDIEEKESKGATQTPAVQGPKSRNKALLLQHADLVAAGHDAAPTEESQILIAGDEWTVVTVETDPAGATHNLVIRR